jgi:hypothetical protein
MSYEMKVDFEEKLMQQVKNINEDLLVMVKSLDQIYNPTYIHKLNVSIVKLSAFEKIYEKEKRQVENILKQIRDRIKVDYNSCMENMNICQGICKENEKKTLGLQNRQSQ